MPIFQSADKTVLSELLEHTNVWILAHIKIIITISQPPLSGYGRPIVIHKIV